MNRKTFLKRFGVGVLAAKTVPEVLASEPSAADLALEYVEVEHFEGFYGTFYGQAHNDIVIGDFLTFTTGGRVATYRPHSKPPIGVALENAKRGEKVLMKLAT